ncbi:MAG: hypothetical protein ACI304_04430 [Lepagella sp.]
MSSFLRGLIPAALLLTILVGCKPTEQNYKAAYDAALAKREQAAIEQMRPATGLLSDDGPQMRIIGADTVYVNRAVIRTEDNKRPQGSWAVAVGMFKMDTNARAAAENLKSEGWKDAFMAKSTGSVYYSILGTATSLDDANAIQKDFRSKHPDYPFIGLPGAPVLLHY